MIIFNCYVSSPDGIIGLLLGCFFSDLMAMAMAMWHRVAPAPPGIGLQTPSPGCSVRWAKGMKRCK